MFSFYRALGQTLISNWKPAVPEIPILCQHMALGGGRWLYKGASWEGTPFDLLLPSEQTSDSSTAPKPKEGTAGLQIGLQESYCLYFCSAILSHSQHFPHLSTFITSPGRLIPRIYGGVWKWNPRGVALPFTLQDRPNSEILSANGQKQSPCFRALTLKRKNNLKLTWNLMGLKC